MNYHIEHPVIDDRMARLRQRDCSLTDFRRYIQEIAQLMVPAVTANFLTLPMQVETPLAITTGRKLERDIVLVPILRAGLGMLEYGDERLNKNGYIIPGLGDAGDRIFGTVQP